MSPAVVLRKLLLVLQDKNRLLGAPLPSSVVLSPLPVDAEQDPSVHMPGTVLEPQVPVLLEQQQRRLSIQVKGPSAAVFEAT